MYWTSRSVLNPRRDCGFCSLPHSGGCRPLTCRLRVRCARTRRRPVRLCRWAMSRPLALAWCAGRMRLSAAG